MVCTVRALVLHLLVLGTSLALEPIEARDGKAPNHLVPVDPRSDEYMALIEKKLLVTDGGFGRMVLRPSFSGEMAVSAGGFEWSDDFPRGPRRFRITLTEAASNLYYSLPENNDAKKRREVRVRRVDVEIDRDFAVAIQRAWASFLVRTRYPKDVQMGVDGYTAEFSVWVRGRGTIYGETWSPQRGLPSEFVELGLDLAKYCRLSAKKRPAAREALMKRLASFERRASAA